MIIDSHDSPALPHTSPADISGVRRAGSAIPKLRQPLHRPMEQQSARNQNPVVILDRAGARQGNVPARTPHRGQGSARSAPHLAIGSRSPGMDLEHLYRPVPRIAGTHHSAQDSRRRKDAGRLCRPDNALRCGANAISEDVSVPAKAIPPALGVWVKLRIELLIRLHQLHDHR